MWGLYLFSLCLHKLYDYVTSSFTCFRLCLQDWYYLPLCWFVYLVCLYFVKWFISDFILFIFRNLLCISVFLLLHSHYSLIIPLFFSMSSMWLAEYD